MKRPSQEETTTTGMSQHFFNHCHRILFTFSQAKEKCDRLWGKSLCLLCKSSGAIRCECREIQLLQCGILTALLPSETHRHSVLCSKPKTVDRHRMPEQNPQYTASYNLYCISITHACIFFLSFLNVHTFKDSFLLFSEKDNITINKQTHNAKRYKNKRFLFLSFFGLP